MYPGPRQPSDGPTVKTAPATGLPPSGRRGKHGQVRRLSPGAGPAAPCSARSYGKVAGILSALAAVQLTIRPHTIAVDKIRSLSAYGRSFAAIFLGHMKRPIFDAWLPQFEYVQNMSGHSLFLESIQCTASGERSSATQVQEMAQR